MTGTVHAEPALIAQGLRKVFEHQDGAAVCALDAVSLEAEQGALTALVGPDGAGKTTLMRLAAGLLRADGGSLRSSASTWPPIRSRFRTASATCRSALVFMRI